MTRWKDYFEQTIAPPLSLSFSHFLRFLSLSLKPTDIYISVCLHISINLSI